MNYWERVAWGAVRAMLLMGGIGVLFPDLWYGRWILAGFMIGVVLTLTGILDSDYR